MGLIDRIGNDFLRTDPATGQRIFFPHSPRARGYVVQDSHVVARLRRTIDMLHVLYLTSLSFMVLLVATTNLGVALWPDWLLFGSILIMAVCFLLRFLSLKHLVKGLPPSDYRLSRAQRQNEPASLSRIWLIATLLALMIAVLPEVLRDLISRDSWLPWFRLACICAAFLLLIYTFIRRRTTAG